MAKKRPARRLPSDGGAARYMVHHAFNVTKDGEDHWITAGTAHLIPEVMLPDEIEAKIALGYLSDTKAADDAADSTERGE